MLPQIDRLLSVSAPPASLAAAGRRFRSRELGADGLGRNPDSSKKDRRHIAAAVGLRFGVLSEQSVMLGRTALR